ncbi:MAG: MarR family winged helix-turn-helix transcriptional regulator [Bacillota bacterium]
MKIGNLENVAGDFLKLLGYIREKFFRPVELITRSRLSPIQFYAVSVLYRKGSLSMSELAGEMQISKQQLTPLIYKLIDNGLLVKKSDQNDRRVVRIEITKSGRNTVEALFSEIKPALAEKLSALPGAELEELEQMLKRIQEIMKSVR